MKERFSFYAPIFPLESIARSTIKIEENEEERVKKKIEVIMENK